MKKKVLAELTFDWVKNLDDVWSIPPWDVPELHGKAMTDFKVELDHLQERKDSGSPPGMVVSGPGGTGKTHLLSRFCRETLDRGGFFLLADMSAIRDSLETVLKGMARSLISPLDYLRGKTQAGRLAENILSHVSFQVPKDFPLRYTRHNPLRLHRDMDKLQQKLAQAFPREAVEHQDILRTILLLNSRDPFLNKAAFSWLKGQPVSLDEATATGYTVGRGEAESALSGLSFFMSLNGSFSVLALDQMDHIVSLFSLVNHNGQMDLTPSVSTARAIITNLSDGLGRLTALTLKTLTVLSCLPLTWDGLLGYSSANTSLQRYRRPPVYLSPLNSEEEAALMVKARLKAAFEKAGWDPPHPTWPFRPEAFKNIEGINPRALMERCHSLVREKILKDDPGDIPLILDSRPGAEPLEAGATLQAEEAPGEMAGPKPRPGAEGPGTGGSPWGRTPDEALFRSLEDDYQRLIRAAAAEEPKYERASDHFWPEAFLALFTTLGAALEKTGEGSLSVTGADKLPRGLVEARSLKKGKGERRLLIRANLYQNPKTFQNRMETLLAYASAGGRTPRRLSITRFIPRPSGEKSGELALRFEALGGRWLNPADGDVKRLQAFLELEKKSPKEEFRLWAAQRRPWEEIEFLREELAFLFPED
ncbi:MAG: ATP-binding protein [Deltaproteobacteria bacterium]|nr:ATP-binding protein [Deltaproteobacteria bacterium]